MAPRVSSAPATRASMTSRRQTPTVPLGTCRVTPLSTRRRTPRRRQRAPMARRTLGAERD
eukprot:11202701-Lingulodinium_polyedra.AAC.1